MMLSLLRYSAPNTSAGDNTKITSTPEVACELLASFAVALLRQFSIIFCANAADGEAKEKKRAKNDTSLSALI